MVGTWIFAKCRDVLDSLTERVDDIVRACRPILAVGECWIHVERLSSLRAAQACVRQLTERARQAAARALAHTHMPGELDPSL